MDNNIVKNHQVGRFEISRDLINKSPDIVLAFMSSVLVVEATAHFYPDTIEYIGYSHYFEPVPEGSVCPLYTWALEMTENGDVVNISATRK
jgi:hypothetical protein